MEGSRLKPFDCHQASCECLVPRTIFDRMYHVCAMRGCTVNALCVCPKVDSPIPKYKPEKKHKNQTKEDMKREIMKSKMIKEARTGPKKKTIEELLKEYK